MLRILIVGGFDEMDEASLPKLREFAGLLGKEVIVQGHALLNACRTSFDTAVAESAHTEAVARGLNPADRIISYVLSGHKPAHNLGNVRTSQLVDWELGNPKFRVPEPIDSADAVLVVGGFTGTHRATNWARIGGKPILPIPRFGGAPKADIGFHLPASVSSHRLAIKLRTKTAFYRRKPMNGMHFLQYRFRVLSGHDVTFAICPISGAKRTLRIVQLMSSNQIC
jgi:hypothetical protein